MQLTFTKMHGLGNDFVVFDFRDRAETLTPQQIRFIADRNFGIGCDQVLVLERANNPAADVCYRIFNADGGEVEQCGNGARCIAVYLSEHGLAGQEVIRAQTKKELLELTLMRDGQVRVNMGKVDFTPSAIPLASDVEAESYLISTASGEFQVNALSIGNPHAVLLVEDTERAAVSTIGPEIQQAALFPQGVNVGFMQILGPAAIRLRVYERGAGETLACGSGACAAVAAGQRYHGLAETVEVNLKGGKLSIQREHESQPVWMIGPAETVFSGTIKL